MKITLASSAGYCFGVRRAVDMALSGAPAYTTGPLIHNADAVRELESRGVRAVSNISEIPPGSRIIIRSHGVSAEEYARLSAIGPVTDATCPYVKAIHAMVARAAQQGVPVIVAGQREHPEVQAILARAGERACAVADEGEALSLTPLPCALVVSQTTLGTEKFEKICAALKTRVTQLDIRDTVCDATRRRQAECEQLAAENDVMLVVGDRQSANTRRLYEIARAHCRRAYLIEGAEALSGIDISPGDDVGITAGASTPRRKYEEVIARMNDIETKVNTVDENMTAAENAAEADFASQFEKTMVQIRPGQTVTGRVLGITEDEVFVSVGYKMDGLIKKSDLCDTDVKIDDEIEVEVVKVNDGDGNVMLSQKNIINRKLWDEIVAKSENGEYIDAVGKEAVKGGLICDVNGIRTFVPASQLAGRYVDKIEQFVGKEMKLKIIELDRAKKRIVASRKAVLEEEAAAKKQAIWAGLQKDAIVTGTVRRLTDFGAFVDIGGVDGLVHVTNLSWGRVQHPSDVVKVGEQIQVKILDLDPERDRISLSRKATMPRPWTVAEEKYPVGSVVEGKVVRLTTFGAFVELESGLDGLVHISQCATRRVEKVEDAVKVGDIVRVKVLDVDTEKKRISLSIRAVLEDEAMAGTGDISDEYAIDEDIPEVEAPAEEAPAEEAPAEEAPAEEAPAEEAPAEAPAE
ncbi:MAG: bifunctional 4-hydroxy-3-methylbut-2-enyl diphosphate reductase/30S ribosomal protein S1 [Clostridia bacterium]|nr:bifunctional 4-hydroxy-3-methylbut-2-enyl diphosphate reductase/30S ribosomal protein S1 [Clostridia bacterium]